ncbi:hypothetical protein JTB14_021640 [Gonioctena quinquepunctata]|nr:hypothetical protein JTB14_021640 [Gonioctena quinquepunctata]
MSGNYFIKLSAILHYFKYISQQRERDLTAQEIEGIEGKPKILDGAVGFTWLLSSESEAITGSLVVGIEDIIFDETYFKTVDKMKYFCEKLKMSHEKILEVSELTVGQAQNEKWLVCRKHCHTAWNFGAVLGVCKRNRFPKSLLKKLARANNLMNYLLEQARSERYSNWAVIGFM